MRVIIEQDLRSFDWSDSAWNVLSIFSEEELDRIEDAIDEMWPGPDAVEWCEINYLVATKRDLVAEMAGYGNWEEVEKLKTEGDIWNVELEAESGTNVAYEHEFATSEEAEAWVTDNRKKLLKDANGYRAWAWIHRNLGADYSYVFEEYAEGGDAN